VGGGEEEDVAQQPACLLTLKEKSRDGETGGGIGEVV